MKDFNIDEIFAKAEKIAKANRLTDKDKLELFVDELEKDALRAEDMIDSALEQLEKLHDVIGIINELKEKLDEPS
jgi:hypothetical protein